MKINNIKKMRNYISRNSTFSERTVNNVIKALGYSLNGSSEAVKEISTEFVNCAEYGANVGISGFIYYSETIAFFKKNRTAIANHIERTAEELGTDIISMVQNFGVFRNSEKPTPSEIGKALWGNNRNYTNSVTLYNVFAWYALEEISNTWYRYLEENPTIRNELAA